VELTPFELEFTAGNDRVATVTCAYPFAIPEQGIEAGDPMPVTGLAMWFTAKHNEADPDPGVFQKTSGVGEGISARPPPNNHVAEVAFDRSDTLQFIDNGATLHCDVAVMTADNNLWTVAEGSLTLLPAVTHAPAPV